MERSVPEVEFMLQGMADLAKATNYYRKKLQDEGFTAEEAMAFAISWHDNVLPKLVDKHLQGQ
tara:strand:- start:730 stop:918 length:189 start_codon:yes stop_codon:yes gene_type:complete